MNATQDLDGVDRATLRAWRGANVLGWSFLALVVGVFGNWVALNAASATAGAIGGAVAVRSLVAVLYAALVGAVIGSIIGLRVYRPPAVIAGAVAFLAAGLFPEVAVLFPAFALGWIVNEAAAIAAAAVVARAVWNRRPAALRGA